MKPICKGHRKIAGSGRKKGTPNKLTMAAKEAFEYAFQEIGGPQALASWAKKNQTMFYRLFARLIPLSLNVDTTVMMLSYAEERAREKNAESSALVSSSSVQ